MSARPIFGNEEEIVTVNCGDCDCVYKETTTYFLWIRIGSDRELVDIDCSMVI